MYVFHRFQHLTVVCTKPYGSFVYAEDLVFTFGPLSRCWCYWAPLRIITDHGQIFGLLLCQ